MLKKESDDIVGCIVNPRPRRMFTFELQGKHEVSQKSTWTACDEGIRTSGALLAFVDMRTRHPAHDPEPSVGHCNH